MQIKISLRLHLTPVRMAKINKTVYACKDVGKEEHVSFLVGVQTGTATMEISVEDLQNLKIDGAQICSTTLGGWHA